MIPLGLSATEQRALTDTLLGSHSIHVTVQILNTNGDRLADVSDRLLSGQVTVDRTAAITRSCTLSLLDPNRTLHFDSDSPSDAALYVDRMVKVTYSVKENTTGSSWVDIPLFCGPVSTLDRTDDVVNVEAQGKETLAMGASWKTHTYKKGHYKVDVLKAILNDLAGETKFSFPEYTAKLPLDLSIARASSPWKVAQDIAKGMNLQLFYDGRGVARLRRLPTAHSFVFQSGDGGSVLSSPQISYTTENLKNIVTVKGSHAISVYAAAPASHPLSPQRLGRNGVPRYLLEEIVEITLRTKSEALTLARDTLEARLLEAITVAFDALPIPYLEPGDVVRVTTSEFSNQFRLDQFTIPLVVGESMSVNYAMNKSPNKKRIRG